MTLRRIPTNSFRKLVHVASRAIIVASLFLLQALPSVASPQMGDLSEQAYSVANPYCNAQSNTPAEHRHEHSGNCVFCCFNQSRDGVRCILVPPVALRFPSFSVIHPQQPPHESSASVSGWTSAWSSRSPPTFS